MSLQELYTAYMSGRQSRSAIRAALIRLFGGAAEADAVLRRWEHGTWAGGRRSVKR